MPDPVVISPGTVSKILWHFTGGPTWNKESNKQNTSPKSAKEAYKALISIIESRELRVGGYSEVVNVRIKRRVKSARKKKIKKKIHRKDYTNKIKANLLSGRYSFNSPRIPCV